MLVSLICPSWSQGLKRDPEYTLKVSTVLNGRTICHISQDIEEYHKNHISQDIEEYNKNVKATIDQDRAFAAEITTKLTGQARDWLISLPAGTKDSRSSRTTSTCRTWAISLVGGYSKSIRT